MQYQIIGDDLQVLRVLLEPGEEIQAEPGAMLCMDELVKMEVRTGGIFKGLKRKLSGESFFLAVFRNTSEDLSQMVCFAAPYPGKILAVNLSDYGGEIICQRGAFFCGTPDVEVSVAFTKNIGAGLFGGEGFVLQKIRGEGMAFIHAGGMIFEEEVAEEQLLRVDTGCLVAFSAGMEFGVESVGGFKKVLFAREGLFFATLKGPGRVFVQSLPLRRLAQHLADQLQEKKN